MTTQRLPLLLLGGRDRRRKKPHEETRGGQQVLRGYKAMELEVGGKPLIVRLLERLRACGAFDPIFVAGPASVYASLAGEVHLVDTDGGFGDNIRAGLDAIVARQGAGRVAVMTTDVLPDPGELAEMVEDVERHQPWDFWCVQCRADDLQELGASAWKPKYRILPEGEDDAVATVPGHLVGADLRVFRMDLIYDIFELAYRTRNQPIGPRRRRMVRGALTTLIRADLKRLFTLRRPGILWDMLVNCLALIRQLVGEGCPQREMEDRLRRMWVGWRHRREHPERRGRVMITSGLSLGRDIDTEEEAREILSGEG
ncbi:MAG: NTP transferase domain-containing protein [bacterium]|nr:NTP transferase domain-containing protein [bacterium]